MQKGLLRVNSRRPTDLIYLALTVSVAVHLLLAWATRFLPPPPFPESAKTSQIEIEIKETDKVIYKETQQIVRDAFVPEDLKVRESEDPLAFFSKSNQRVKKQLRALMSGLTANRAAEKAAKEKDPRENKKRTINRKLYQLADKTSPIKMPTADDKNDFSDPSSVRFPTGLSTVGESLPEELEIGSFTSLNTDRYLYYTFFARVEELIRYNWENSVRTTIDRTPKRFFEMNLRSRWDTQVEILLKPSGEFHKALLMKESGVNGFDWAAMDCFSSAKIFPHPPKEMVEADGLIHLRYTFTVRFNPKALVQK